LELRPICVVLIQGPTRYASIRALVDSGATHPFFPESAAIEAGLDLERAQRFHCDFVGASTEGRKVRNVTLAIRGHRLVSDIVFIEDAMIDHFGLPLLGRAGVFSSFDEIAFRERDDPMRVELRW